jgi:hypothetical protein
MVRIIVHIFNAMYAQKNTWPQTQWEGSACTRSALIFIYLSCSWHVPFKFPTHSNQVLNMFPKFPMCSTRVFPLAPCFNPICFAQSPPLFTYIAGLKGEALHRMFYVLGASLVWTFFLQWTNQIDSLQKRKFGLTRHPQLIDMKQNKYPN